MVLVQYYLAPDFVGDLAHGSSTASVVFHVSEEEMMKHFGEEKALMMAFPRYNALTVYLTTQEMNNIEPYRQGGRIISYNRLTANQYAPLYPYDEVLQGVTNYFNTHPEIPDNEVIEFDEKIVPFVRPRTDVSTVDLPLDYIGNLYKSAKIKELFDTCKKQTAAFILKNEPFTISLDNPALTKNYDIVPGMDDLLMNLYKGKWVEVLMKYHNSPVMEIIDKHFSRCTSPPGRIHMIELPRANDIGFGKYLYIVIPDDLNPDNVRFLTEDEYRTLSGMTRFISTDDMSDDDMFDD